MKLDRIADIAFFGLCFTIYISLNSITDTYFGVKNIASPLILMLSLILITVTGFKRSSFEALEIKLFYAFFISYYAIGLAVRFYRIEINYDVSLSLQLNNLLTSLIIIICFHQYLYIRLIQHKKETIVFNSFYIPIMIAVLFTLYQSYLGIVDLTGGKDGRFSSFYQNPNALGLVANIGLILNLYSLLRHKNGFILKLILLPIILYVSFLSLSRTSIVTSGMVIVLTVFWMLIKFFKTQKTARKRSFIVFGPPIYIIAYIALNFETLVYKYLDHWQAKKMLGLVDLVFKGKVNSENTSSRSEHIDIFYKSFIENPFFGKGLAYFADIPNYRWGVHNTYLLVLGDTGIIPFFFLLFFICYVSYRAIFMTPTNGIITIGLLSVWVLQCMASHNGLDDKMFLILLIFTTMYSAFGNSSYYSRNIKSLSS